MISLVKSTPKPIFRVESVTQMLPRATWNEARDIQLKSLLEENGEKNWRKVAISMNLLFNDQAFTAKRCRERWFNCVNPNINKGSLRELEELLVLAYHHEYGNKWTMISGKLASRNSMKIKNNFVNLILKTLRRIEYLDAEGDGHPGNYIKKIYSTILIMELIINNNSSQRISQLVPIYMCNIIKSKAIPLKQCISYVTKCSEALLLRHSSNVGLKDLLKLNEMSAIKSYIIEVLNNIKSQYKPITGMCEPSLISIMESVIKKKDYLNMFQDEKQLTCSNNAHTPEVNELYDYSSPS